MKKTGIFHDKASSTFKFCPMCGASLIEDSYGGLICGVPNTCCDVTWVEEESGKPGEGYWGSWTWTIKGEVWGCA